MATTKKELSYFRLKLEAYLGEHFPERVNDNARPLQNLPLSQFSPIYTLRRMNIFDRKMPLEVIFE